MLYEAMLDQISNQSSKCKHAYAQYVLKFTSNSCLPKLCIINVYKANPEVNDPLEEKFDYNLMFYKSSDRKVTSCLFISFSEQNDFYPASTCSAEISLEFMNEWFFIILSNSNNP